MGTLMFSGMLTLEMLTCTETDIINNMPIEYVINVQHIVDAIIMPIKKKYGSLVRVSSCYRSKEVNRAVNGTEHSSHLTGQAIDISVDGVSPEDLKVWCEENIVTNYMKIYPTHLHITKRMW